jgi:hypothetical protein
MVQTTRMNARLSPSEASCAYRPDDLAESAASSISFHMNEIPEFTAATLERLYGNLHSSLEHFRDSGALDDAITYVVRNSGQISTIFLFRIENGRAQVLNEVIPLDEHDVAQFVGYVFSAFRAVQVIVFRAVQLEIGDLCYPHQRFNYLEDIVVPLPASTDEYMGGLSKKMRRNMRRHLKYVRHDFPAFSYETFDGDDVNEQHIRDIIALNHARMSDKNKASDIDETETARLIALVRRSGLIGIVSIHGKVAAGVIIYRSGANYFLLVLAHDSQYNSYGMGALCCYLSICECIRRGGAEYHFLWGRYDYKYWFGGIQRDLDQLVIYRSRVHFLWNGAYALRAWAKALRRQAMLGLQRAKQNESVLGRFAIGALNGVRSLQAARNAVLGR